MAKRPNILWILTDQHHADALGFVGRREVRTPNLDRLARDGVHFPRAYCNSPICGPSRCSMITGLYPRDTGITGNAIFEADLPPPASGTVATRLRESGYQSFLVGKGHMIRRWDVAGFERRSYSDLCDASGGDPATVGYFKHLIEHGLADEYDLGTRLPGQPGHGLEGWVSSLPEEHSVEAWAGREALAMLTERDRDRPFFMQLSFQRPHEPLCVPPERAEEYDPDAVRLPESSSDFFVRRFAGKPDGHRAYVTGGSGGYPYRPADEAALRRQLARYYTLITMIDERIGRVIEHLEAAGDYDDTLIVFTADHGDFAGDHGLMLKNLGLYESVHRVPLVVKPPSSGAAGGGGPGTRCEALVELVDVAPTLLAAAGLRPAPGLPGRDLLRVCGGAAPARSEVVCEFEFNAFQPYAVAVRSERHRLVLYPWQPGERGELYDHARDAGELENLIDDPDHQPVRLELTEAALAHTSRHRRLHTFAQDAQEPITLRTLVQNHGFKHSVLAATPR